PHLGPLTGRPVDVGGLHAQAFETFLRAQRRPGLLVELRERREVFGRVLTLRAEPAPDVFTVAHDLTECDIRRAGRLAVAVDDLVVARTHVGRRALGELAEVAVDELVEAEARLDQPAEEVRRSDVAGRGEVADELLDV